MRIHVRGHVIGAYRRDIDTACPSDEAAEAAILAMAEYARVVETAADGTTRRRAGKAAGRPWSRCYVVVSSRGDVIDVQPESPHGRGGRGNRAAHDARRAETRWPVVAVVDGPCVRLTVHTPVLTPDEARDLAGRLLECADRAEAT